MAARLTLWWQGGGETLELTEHRYTVGRAAENDVVLYDPSVSALHAVIEDHGAGWTVRDLASTNGTWIKNERIWTEHRVRPDEDLRFGRVRARLQHEPTTTTTEPESAMPPITDREQEVLIELCRPLVSGGAFTPPASVADIARHLYISPGAVKQHLNRMYRKFEIAEDQDRRVALANAAFQRGAVHLDDLLTDSGQ